MASVAKGITALMAALAAGVWGVAVDTEQAVALPVPASYHVERDQGESGSSAAIVPAGDATASFNWAGYVADDASVYTEVSSSWVVPHVRANTESSADATWVGIGGTSSHDLIQAGTEALPGDDGNPVYAAWYETLPQDSRIVPLAIAPGDKVTVAILEVQPKLWLIQFHNDTTGESYEKHVRYASSRSSAGWIEEMPISPDQPVALDDFGSIRFENAFAVQDGERVTIKESGAVPLRMDNQARETIAMPSKLSEDGAGFSVERTDAPAAPLRFARRGEWQTTAASPPASGSIDLGAGVRIIIVRFGG